MHCVELQSLIQLHTTTRVQRVYSEAEKLFME